MNHKRWIDDKNVLHEFSTSGPDVLPECRFVAQWILHINVPGQPGRQKDVKVELNLPLFEHFGGFKAPDGWAQFRECLLEAASQALFMGRLTEPQTVTLGDSDDNVLRMRYTPASSLCDLANARFEFTKDLDYELDVADAFRRRILLTLKPHYSTGMSAQELLSGVGLSKQLVSDHVEWLRKNGHVRVEFSGSDTDQNRLWITESGVEAISASAVQQPVGGPSVEGHTQRDINVILGGDVVEKKVVQSADGCNGPVVQFVGDVGGSVNVCQTWSEMAANVDIDELATQLERLRAAMRGLAKSAEQDVAVGAVAEAAQAAKAKEGPRALEALRKAGRWTLDVAEQVGVPLLVDVLKKTLGFPT